MLQDITNYFHIDQISMIMLSLISFIGICIGGFSLRYMKGDSRYGVFFFYLFLLITSIGIMVSTDHLALLLAGWCTSNLLLVRLMIHKTSWTSAKNSGLLAGKNYLFGAFCIGTGFILLNYATGETSIHALIHKHSESPLILPSLFLLLIGAMTQSAIWPFHRWLISSLNSPTPVSALMHAGLINGGGFLLARFAPLYLEHSFLLTAIFVLGITTAIIGTLWKLLQNDVKRMLACSTMGQMGFMVAQCGLGLFTAAIAHLVSHGMFKAYLFLASGSVAQEKRHDLDYPPKAVTFTYALICGLLGSFCFSFASGKSWHAKDTTLVLIVIAFLTATQYALAILSLKTRFRLLLTVSITSIISLVYGSILFLMTKAMEPMQLMRPQPLNGLHIAGIFLLITSWLSVLFLKKSKNLKVLTPWIRRGYVVTLNASQPHKKTITTHRNDYKYI